MKTDILLEYLRQIWRGNQHTAVMPVLARNNDVLLLSMLNQLLPGLYAFSGTHRQHEIKEPLAC